MNRRDTERERRSHKRSRSPEDRDWSPRDDKRRRSDRRDDRRDERRDDRRNGRDRSPSPKPSRSSSMQNGRDERHHRRDERRERDTRSPVQDEPRRPDRETRKLPPIKSSHVEKVEVHEEEERRLSTSPKPVMEIDPRPATKGVTAAALLYEEDPPLSKLMGFSRFHSTKGKKHEDFGAVDLIKKRTYRQYMNRPGGFNRPLDGA